MRILPVLTATDLHSQISAEKLAAEGYCTFAADINSDGNKPADQKKQTNILPITKGM